MFRRFTKSRKRTIASLTVVAVLGIAGAAIAYFTTTGSGTGTAGVGTSAALTITQTGAVSNLSPGAAAQPVAYTITNSSSGGQNLGIVSATVASVTPVGSNTCATSNFTTTPATTAVGTIAGGATFTSTTATQPTVQMTETGTNQNGCQGATVNLTLTAAAGS